MILKDSRVVYCDKEKTGKDIKTSQISLTSSDGISRSCASNGVVCYKSLSVCRNDSVSSGSVPVQREISCLHMNQAVHLLWIKQKQIPGLSVRKL